MHVRGTNGAVARPPCPQVEVLRRLAGSLNVVKLVDVYEDADNVHIVQVGQRKGMLAQACAGAVHAPPPQTPPALPASPLPQEWCKGGELLHSVGTRHYSERTVASYMRAVLRTLAQCHAQHILHRDVKPENFMLLSDDERSPLKAIGEQRTQRGAAWLGGGLERLQRCSCTAAAAAPPLGATVEETAHNRLCSSHAASS
jgi:serine/threonine protein kinase